MHPSIHFDLQKYHAEAWDMLERTEKADIYRCVSANMNKGHQGRTCTGMT